MRRFDRCAICHDCDCPGCAEDEVNPLLADDCPPNWDEDDSPREREYDYQADLDAKWAARERHLDAWRLKR
jgi:hypothetical protein